MTDDFWKRIFDWFFDFAQRNWARPVVGAVVSLFVGGLLSYESHGWFPSLAWYFLLAVGVASGGLTLASWWWTNRLPQRPPGKIGFLVAIACDNDAAQRKFRADFIDRLRDNLMQNVPGHGFSLMVLPRVVAENANTEEEIEVLLRRTGAHFVVAGKVRERTDPSGDATHLMTLNGWVIHAETTPENKQQLVNEMVRVMPRKVLVPDKGSVFAFEAASDWLDLAARYVIGCAAYVTGDVECASQLLLSVEQRIPSRGKRLPQLVALKQQLPTHLLSVYSTWLSRIAQQYHLKRDDALLAQGEKITQMVLERDPTNYAAITFSAMCAFVLRRDVAQAKKLLRAKVAAKKDDTTWRYSLAFLYAYEGRMNDAEKEYRLAFKGNCEDETVPIQTEEFIQGILLVEPEKGRLHYCAGLVNYHAKNDHVACNRDLQAFLASNDATAYPAQRLRAEQMLHGLNLDPPTDDDVQEVDLLLRPTTQEEE